jgi:RimJ/RimL family protein N-acetyltransferase
MSGPVVIETERLILRPHVANDWDAVFALWSDAQTSRFISANPSTREQSWAQLLRYMGLWPALGFGYFAVVDKSTQEFIGEIGLADFHRNIVPSLEGTAEMGWILMPHVWGKGIASEAIMAILDWYRQTPNARPISCIIDKNNTASVKLAQKCGFQEIARTPYKDSETITFWLA